jgi:hypothetical protein
MDRSLEDIQLAQKFLKHNMFLMFSSSGLYMYGQF